MQRDREAEKRGQAQCDPQVGGTKEVENRYAIETAPSNCRGFAKGPQPASADVLQLQIIAPFSFCCYFSERNVVAERVVAEHPRLAEGTQDSVSAAVHQEDHKRVAGKKFKCA